MKRYIVSILKHTGAVAGAIVIAVPALAVTTEWNRGYEDLNPVDGTKDTGTWLWNDSSNWTSGVPANGVGDVINFKRLNWNKPIGIDTTGATLALGDTALTGNYNGDYNVIFDQTKLTPIYKATPTPNTLLESTTSFTPVSPLASLTEAANASPTLSLKSIFCNKQNVFWFYHPVNITDDITSNGTDLNFYGALTVGGTMNFNGRSDTNDTQVFNSTVNGVTLNVGNSSNARSTVTANDTVTLTTLNINSAAGVYNAAAGAGSGGSGATINVDAGTLNFAVQQTTFPSQVNVAAYAVVAGDFTGATYGANVILAEDSVLALTANEPGDTTPGVFDAKYWKGVTDKANDVVTEAGDDGGSVYKGVAVGPWASGDMSGTIQAPAGVAELGVVIAGGQTKFTSNSEMLMTDTGTSQTANISVASGATLFMDGGAINQNSAADAGLQVTTFNVTGPGGDGSTLYLNNNAVMAGQTYNLYNGVCYTNTNGQGNYGTVILHDGSGFYCNGSQAFKNQASAGQYVFEDDTVIRLGSNLQSALDQDGATVTTGIDDTGFFWLKGETIGCFDSRDQSIVEGGAMADIIKACNVSMSNNNAYRFGGYGLHLGDGKYLLLERNVDSAANGTTFIGTDPGSSTVGIAAEPGSNNSIAAPFDSNGATLVIGSDNPLTFVNTGTNSWNQRSTDMATGTVRLTGGLANTNQIDIKSGTLNLDYAQDLGSTDVLIGANGTLNASQAVTIGTLSGNGTVNNASNLTFGTVAPGASVGALNMSPFTMPAGSTYQWEVGGTGGTAGTDYDWIVASDVTFGGAWNLNISNAGLANGALDGSEIFILMDTFTANSFTAPTVTGAGFNVAGVSVYVGTGDDEGRIMMTGLVGPSGAGGGPTDADDAVSIADFTSSISFDPTGGTGGIIGLASGSFAGFTGGNYTVEWSPDLVTDFVPVPGMTWPVAGTGTSGTSGVAIPWSYETGDTAAFFRLVIE